jgi:hypothetical protein
MVKPIRKVVIDNEAKIALREAYQFIKNDSLQNAEKVRTGILRSIKQLVKNTLQNIHQINSDRIKTFLFVRMKYSDTE